jgi:thymidine kinase
MNVDSAYLELIIGPMFSGKTSRLVDIYKQCKFCNISVSVINHSVDERYHDTMLSTHDKIMIPCIQTVNLCDVWEHHDVDRPVDELSIYHLQLRDAEVILINEGQFFGDLLVCVENMLKENKKVYVGGLDGDFERKRFGQILDLQRRTTEGAEGSGGGERGEGGEVTRVRAVEFKEMVEQVCAF